jgi:DNA/RNA-binding domain of Phe-tRNA-synthetase-like protein
MNQDRNYRLSIRREVLERYPGYSCVVTYLQGIQNDPLDPSSAAILKSAEQSAAARFDKAMLDNHPHIAAWRAAYGSFGAKPKKYLCSVEALLTRVLKGEGLPSINTVVNLYNAISLEHVIPIGGEDWDKLDGGLELMLASGKEPFATRRNGESIVEYPEAGEVVWCDRTGITCRRWNWRQCERTLVTPSTTRGYFVFDCLPPFGLDRALAASQQFIRLVETFSKGVVAETEILHSPRDEEAP